MTPKPFALRVPEEVLVDLRVRLSRARWPDEIAGSGWQYGTELAYLRDLVTYWSTKFDWRAQEIRFNALKHFTVPLSGVDLHFIHEPGHGPAPMPLLLLHGWPGSVWEFHKLIPLLTRPESFGADPHDAFTIVAPSLPGYALSFRPGQPRFDRPAMATMLATLMTEVIGYPRFGAQGGDIGAMVATRLGSAFPDRLFGIHLNYLGGLRDFQSPKSPSPEEEQYAKELKAWLAEEAGYHWIQGTKPQTLSYGLTDSPVGLAAWIVEKFRSWSDCEGDLERRFTKDEILTNLMLYWATRAINSSFWPYYSSRHGDRSAAPDARITVPTGYISFPREILRPPRSIAERVFNIQRWTLAGRGGHFAALEEPEVLATDIRAFFRPLRG